MALPWEMIWTSMGDDVPLYGRGRDPLWRMTIHPIVIRQRPNSLWGTETTSINIRSLARKRRESSCLFGWVSLANTLLQIIYRNVTNKKESKYQMRHSGVQGIEQKIINWSVRIHEPETQSHLTVWDELWQKSYAIFLQMLISEMVVPIS